MPKKVKLIFTSHLQVETVANKKKIIENTEKSMRKKLKKQDLEQNKIQREDHKNCKKTCEKENQIWEM